MGEKDKHILRRARSLTTTIKLPRYLAASLTVPRSLPSTTLCLFCSCAACTTFVKYNMYSCQSVLACFRMASLWSPFDVDPVPVDAVDCRSLSSKLCRLTSAHYGVFPATLSLYLPSLRVQSSNTRSRTARAELDQRHRPAFSCTYSHDHNHYSRTLHRKATITRSLFVL